MTASRHGNIDVVSLLINTGADLKTSDYTLLTPLHLSTLFRDGDEATREEVFATLVRHGLDPHQQDRFSWSPIHRAIRIGSFASILLNSDFRLDDGKAFPWNGLLDNEHMAWLTSHYALFLRKLGLERMRKLANLVPTNTWAPLCIYASQGDSMAVTNLLDLGACLDFEGCPSGSALMAACSAGRLETV